MEQASLDMAAVWTGRALGGIVVLLLLADGLVNLFAPELTSKAMVATGFPLALSRPLGVLILVCAALYAVPQTSVLGAILVTGFLGGAICAHFRLGLFLSPPQVVSLLLGIATWASLYLRFGALQALLPFVR
ncbi:DoxX family protein [Variovorax sp. GT1P44]|uniref:DoxX family protein n=1 Tax=Variovorax sp. GT1P44 TaxID=3443742 RepID=UPI003F48EDEC